MITVGRSEATRKSECIIYKIDGTDKVKPARVAGIYHTPVITPIGSFIYGITLADPGDRIMNEINIIVPAQMRSTRHGIPTIGLCIGGTAEPKQQYNYKHVFHKALFSYCSIKADCELHLQLFVKVRTFYGIKNKLAPFVRRDISYSLHQAGGMHLFFY